MKSLLNYASTIKSFAQNGFTGERRKSRKSSSVTGASYQTLEKRDLLTTFTVTTLQDSLANDGLVSLREAIQAANTNTAFRNAVAGEATGDVIAFAPQLRGQTVRIDAGPLTIRDDLQIIGNVTLDANNQSRILRVLTSEDVVLDGLTFTNAQPEFSSILEGGAINIRDGNVRISDVEIRSTATSSDFVLGGGIFARDSNVQIERTTFTGNSADSGGAIYGRDSEIEIFESTFDSNSGAGGGVFTRGGRLSVVDSTFNENTGASGAAIFTSGALLVTGSTFTSNTTFSGPLTFNNGSENGGGAIRAFNLADGQTPEIVIRDSEFIGNSARGNGGAVRLDNGFTAFVTDTIFEGNVAGAAGGLEALGSSGGGIFSEGSLSVSGSSFLSNLALEGGGGIGAEGGSVHVANSLVSGNRALRTGGGINSIGSDLSLLDSEIINNRVTTSVAAQGTTTTTDVLAGGGVFVRGEQSLDEAATSVFVRNTLFERNIAGHYGGGLANEGATLRIIESTFLRNHVVTVVAPVFGSDAGPGGGGGLFHRPLNRVEANLLVADSLFVQNRISFRGQAVDFGARLDFLGGGISSFSSANFASSSVISNTTFVGNSSEGSGGGVAHSGTSSLRLVSSDFIGNTAGTTQLSSGAGFESIGSDDAPNGLGGALYTELSGSTATLFPVRIFGGEFRANTAINSGGAIFAASSNPQANLLLRATNGEDVRFINNRALRFDGGAIAGDGVGLNARDAVFSLNTARNGGAIFFEGGDELTLFFSQFSRNEARDRGGAINFFDTEFTNFRNVFANNTAIVGPDFFEQT